MLYVMIFVIVQNLGCLTAQVSVAVATSIELTSSSSASPSWSNRIAGSGSGLSRLEATTCPPHLTEIVS